MLLVICCALVSGCGGGSGKQSAADTNDLLTGTASQAPQPPPSPLPPAPPPPPASWGPYTATYKTDQGFEFRVSMTVPQTPATSVALGAPGKETLTVQHVAWGLTVTNVTSLASRPATVLGPGNFFNVWAIWRGPVAPLPSGSRFHLDGAGFTAPGSPQGDLTLAQHESATLPISPDDQPKTIEEQPDSYIKQLEAMYRTRPVYVTLELNGATDALPVEFDEFGAGNGTCEPGTGNELVVAFTGAGKQIDPNSICQLFTG
jgi:hypothetical protein